ncbi:hypothetical protein SPI_00393 [Niveomyces insectorum RCEF 264]|uniref:Uncharacterized protein n=1 Tax=Niveomyces insectorum RCEF 264 TaxID=1081102 RepID=A0A168A3L5_9HYPO|nr:hypothetical protein SPI_00393 [Niveomyces insectorum RCEF 264]
MASTESNQRNAASAAQKPLPLLPPLPTNQRSVLPRGSRFRDLAEAHRNITGRSFSSGTNASNEAGDCLTSTSRSGSVLSQNDACSPMAHTDVRSVLRKPASPDLGRRHDGGDLDEDNDADDVDGDPEDLINKLFSDRTEEDRPPAGSVADAPAVSFLHEEKSNPNAVSSTRDASLRGTAKDDTSYYYGPSTTCRSPVQLQANDGECNHRKTPARNTINLPLNENSPPPPGNSRAAYSREGATTRLDFRRDEAGGFPEDKAVDGIRHGGDASQKPRLLNNIEDLCHDVKEKASARSLLANMPTQERLLVPKPLRVPSMIADGQHAGYRSGAAVSAEGLTTDSDDDPFRYDKDPYKIFLHPSKERDVSAALIHLSGVSSHSRATVYSQNDGIVSRHNHAHTSLHVPAIPRIRLNNCSLASDRKARSLTPESLEEFYDASAVQPNWVGLGGDGTYEVKVVLQDVNDPETTNDDEKKVTENKEKTKGRADSRVLNDKNLLRNSLYYKTGKDYGVLSERDEWETVATSGAGVGSLGLSFPKGFAVDTQGVKLTGNSLADVSDDDDDDNNDASFRRVAFDEYASTDRIVQHPSDLHESEEGVPIRHLSTADFPVLVPKQRVHRVNGFAQDSVVALPPFARIGRDAPPVPAKPASNPFRQLSGKCGHRFSPVPLQPLQPLLPGCSKGKNRYEFRDSACGKGPYEGDGGINKGTGHNKGQNNGGAAVFADANGEEAVALRESGSSQSSASTVHSFPFPLIPLPEAARLQAVQRTGELVDLVGNYCHDGTLRCRYDDHGYEQARSRVPMPEPCLPRHTPTTTTTTTTTSRFASLFNPTPARQEEYDQTGRPRVLANDTTKQSSLSSGAGGRTWATITTPFGSISTRSLVPGNLFKSAATKLRLDSMARKWQQQQMQLQQQRHDWKRQKRPRPSANMNHSSGSSSVLLLSRTNTPRLYPWDYQARRWQRLRGTDPELRAIAATSSHHPALAGTRFPDDDLERRGLPLHPDAFLSREARRRRRVWLLCMLAVSMFPFMSVLVYVGAFDSGLSWYTRGEVDRLSRRQRRTILAVMVLQFVLWPSMLVLVIWRVQQLPVAS